MVMVSAPYVEHLWRVVPICDAQRLDVRPDDLLEGGLYRKCSTYRGGGGYDRFPALAAARFANPGSGALYQEQFIVQLYGCHLDCPYCYVTRSGVWGGFVPVATSDLVGAFLRSGSRVFHLMGGAPALQLKFWPELVRALIGGDNRAPTLLGVFHSDLLLTEAPYDVDVLGRLAAYARRYNLLFAVDVKGTTPAEVEANTRKPFDRDMFWGNFRRIAVLGDAVYVTFTDASEDGMAQFWDEARRERVDVDRYRRDAYNIPLIDYAAVAHVDDRPWGVRR